MACNVGIRSNRACVDDRCMYVFSLIYILHCEFVMHHGSMVPYPVSSRGSGGLFCAGWGRGAYAENMHRDHNSELPSVVNTSNLHGHIGSERECRTCCTSDRFELSTIILGFNEYFVGGAERNE